MEESLHLDDRQARELARILDRAAAVVRVELNHTDTRAFKEELLQRLQMIEEISNRLEKLQSASCA